MPISCCISLPSYFFLLLKIIFAASSWNASNAEFILDSMNMKGIIAGLGIDFHFRILERVFVTGPISEDNEDDIGMIFAQRHRILDENEQQIANLLKQQIVYDIAVELSTICDGTGDNSSLGDIQVRILFSDFTIYATLILTLTLKLFRFWRCWKTCDVWSGR